jgi:hypothetical protein
MQSEDYSKLYDKRSWRRRSRIHRRMQPLCERCLKAGRISVADAVHHTTPHRGDHNIFLMSPLVSLCNACHGLSDAAIRRGFDKTIGEDGWPTCSDHPVYRTPGGREVVLKGDPK